jgi:hypothetical protein
MTAPAPAIHARAAAAIVERISPDLWAALIAEVLDDRDPDDGNLAGDDPRSERHSDRRMSPEDRSDQ